MIVAMALAHTSNAIDRAREALAGAIGAQRVSASSGDREQHARDQSTLPARMPDLVVWPETAEHVSAVLRYANEHGLPVVPWGAGTSLEGNPIPVRGGILLDFARMNRVVAAHAQDFQVTVQPGVLYKDLNRELGKQGLFFAPDPGANASIGGMIANNAAGIRTVKYGATRDNVLALEVVLADGTIVHTGSRSVKQSAGYDLTHLIVGSEGTLAVVTEATLKLVPIPEHFSAIVAAFPSVENAVEAVYAIMASGLEPGAMELVDTSGISMMNKDEGMNFPELPHLFMEFSGSDASGVKSRTEAGEACCRDNQCVELAAGLDRESRQRLWDARHHFYEILIRNHPGQGRYVADVAVPISHLPELIRRTRVILDEVGIEGQIIGHAGDGNLHVTLFYPLEDEAAAHRAKETNTRLVQAALDLDGTCTGEHGVGIGKMHHMLREHGPAGIALMKAIKQTMDPKGILNPGKVLP
jgi:D-lactate dehydrogenase (cytochrome)